MNEDLKRLLVRLKALRPEVPQFVFFSTIYPISVISLRAEILEFKKHNANIQEIDFIVHSGGGLADDAYRVIRTLRNNFITVNVIIPFWAKSAATLLSFGASKIIMDEFGEFGPLDAQIAKAREDGPAYDRESALNDEYSVGIIENRYKLMYEQMFIRLYEHDKVNIPKTELSEQLMKNLTKFFKPLVAQIDSYKLGEKKRTLDIGTQYAKRILLQFGSPNNADSARELVDYLINECPDHGYVIDKDIMKKFLSNIHDSNIFGSEYAEALQELSIYLTKLQDDPGLVGFIEDEPVAGKMPANGDPDVGHNANEILSDKVSTAGEDFVKDVLAVAVDQSATN